MADDDGKKVPLKLGDKQVGWAWCRVTPTGVEVADTEIFEPVPEVLRAIR